ncbi:hypothetical protein B0T26DRAFT_634775 [Lasiosphaeria miniovina]|uniref:HMG box domain-containing protein n=1 Tax=Lasiosphaeria miniovina TaxID=1954250 RepID=A0AA40BH59_9PEZI|nr:uncharacterized protein B0T26DRAFT_634775 [Lasiosphaeria miniovina]KAK0734162.1 hypothetical protein B0T26DRAFT_634775 [Lasiosphaeria miniovina]
MKTLETIFAELSLTEYLDAFVEQGFDTWETILDITESDLDALGVKLGHRRRLQRRIANSRGIAPEASLGSQAQPATDDPRVLDAHRSDSSRLDALEASNVIPTKRKYRRHPKVDENAPLKPPSAYVLFSAKMRDEELKDRNLGFTEIAKLVGENWRSLSPAEKEPFESHAQVAKERYQIEMEEYKKTPQYERYQLYLQEFKAKHDHPQGVLDRDAAKRLKLADVRMPDGGPSSTRSNRTSRSGSEPQREIGSPRHGSQQGIESASADAQFSSSLTPSLYHASLADPVNSPLTKNINRHLYELSPTFNTFNNVRELQPLPSKRITNWADEDRHEQPATQRQLPSLSDVFDRHGLLHEPVGFYALREDAPNSPPAATIANEPRPALRKGESSSSSASTPSSISSLGHPRTPLDNSMPIHSLLSSKPNHVHEGQQQPILPAMTIPGEHGQPFVHQPINGAGMFVANG